MVSEGSDADLECRATGNPLTTSTVSWRRAGFDMQERTVLTTGIGVAYLSVKAITRNDTGSFECVANNGIGEESIERTWLVVKCKSSPRSSASIGRLANPIGASHLIFVLISYCTAFYYDSIGLCWFVLFVPLARRQISR